MTYQQLIERSAKSRKERNAISEALNHEFIPSDFAVLALIHEGDQTVSSLAKRLESSLAYCTNSVHRLSRSGWVKRTGDNDSRKKNLVFIGDEKKFNQYLKALEEIEL